MVGPPSQKFAPQEAQVAPSLAFILGIALNTLVQMSFELGVVAVSCTKLVYIVVF